MVNVILNRLDQLAALHIRAVAAEALAHERAVQAENDRHTAAVAAEHVDQMERLDFELDNLVYNMSQRCKARGIKKKEEKYLWLHTLSFDQTYIDMTNADQKDFRVREYFDPLLVASDDVKKLLLERYALALDRYFPIGRADRAWGPVLRKVPFTPRRKSDKRTETYTIIHNWIHIKEAS